MSVDDAWLRGLVERSSTLTERLGPDFILASGEVEDGRWARWLERIAEGDPRRLARRLEWDGLEEQTVRRALSGARLREDVSLPAWTEVLRACLQRFEDPSTAPERVSSEERRYLEPERPIPFEEALVPFVDWASEVRLSVPAECPPLLASARASAERALLRELSGMCGRVLAEEFSFHRMCHAPGLVLAIDRGEVPSGRTVYTSFLRGLREGGWSELLEEHAVLARLMALTIERWADSIEECLRRLVSDLPTLRERWGLGRELGAITGLDVGLSDPHRGGRRVFRLGFAEGTSLIYKPRSLALEAAWAEVVAWCNREGASPQLRAAAVLDGGTHGWMEEVHPAPCESAAELELHYQRAGMQLALLYALAGTDYHSENLLAAGAHPVLVDHEMLLSPLLRPLDGAETVPEHSVLRTRLLPTREGSGAEDGGDRSGLGGVGGQLTAFQRLAWRGLNTDGMQFVLEPVRTRARSNVPFLEGQPQPAAEHLEPLLSGFRAMYCFLLEHREALLAPNGLLEGLRGLPVRVLLRSTQSYGWLLEHLLAPELLRDGVDRSIEWDLLCRAFLGSEEQHPAWPAVREEAEAVNRLDIPRFTGRTDGTEVILESGRRLEGLSVTSGLEQTRATLRGLGPEDLERQIRLIAEALTP